MPKTTITNSTYLDENGFSLFESFYPPNEVRIYGDYYINWYLTNESWHIGISKPSLLEIFDLLTFTGRINVYLRTNTASLSGFIDFVDGQEVDRTPPPEYYPGIEFQSLGNFYNNQYVVYCNGVVSSGDEWFLKLEVELPDITPLKKSNLIKISGVTSVIVSDPAPSPVYTPRTSATPGSGGHVAVGSNPGGYNSGSYPSPPRRTRRNNSGGNGGGEDNNNDIYTLDDFLERYGNKDSNSTKIPPGVTVVFPPSDSHGPGGLVTPY